MTNIQTYLMRFFSSGAIVLVLLPLLTLLLDVVYDWLSQGRIPPFIPRLTIASLSQASTVLATLLLVTTRVWSGPLMAIVLLALFLQLLLLVLCGALVQQARRLTEVQVRKVLEGRLLTTKSIESSILNTILDLGDKLVVEDLHPHNVRTRLSGEDNAQRRELFLKIVALIISDSTNRVTGDELLLPEKTRSLFARLYGICGMISFVLFITLLMLSGISQ
jgi:hypothetical protein